MQGNIEMIRTGRCHLPAFLLAVGLTLPSSGYDLSSTQRPYWPHVKVTERQVPERIGRKLVFVPPLVSATGDRLVAIWGSLPLSFEANQGQTDSRVRFISRGNRYTLFLTATEAVLSLRQPSVRKPTQDGSKQNTKASVLYMKLLGANPAPRVDGLEELPSKSNYFVGNEPLKWRTNVPTFAKVRYEAVYPGIDLVYYGKQGQLEYDFVIAAGANPNVIEVGVWGADESEIDPQGDLVLPTGGRNIRLHKPFAYQETQGIRRQIPCRYVFRGKNRIALSLASYDISRPLVIDPVLSYATYVGGERTDQSWSIAVDSSGNAYITGHTNSGNFPTTASAFQRTCSHCSPDNADAFVAKLNASGTALLYATYLGGNLPPISYDVGFGIAVDSSGNAYVTGITSSSNFPTTPLALQRAPSGSGDHVFVTKLNPTGSELVYSTYLGHAIQNTAIAVDATGNAYVAGSTGSVFVAKLNASGSALVYSKSIGPGVPSEIPGGGIAVDSGGNAYLTGETSAQNFPVTPGAFQTACNNCPFFSDAFVAKLDASGSIVYSTYLGGSAKDRGLAVAVDSGGNAYVAGATTSRNFPTVNALQPIKEGPVDAENAFVAKLNASGSALIFSTFLGADRGGSGAYGIAVDAGGSAHVTGTGMFVTKLNPAGSGLVYSVRLGSGFGFGIAADSASNVYVTGVSSTLSTTPGAVQTAYGGGSWDSFAAKILGPPKINPGGTVNAASFAGGAAVTPGSIASVFGLNFAASQLAADTLPLPTSLGATRFQLGGHPVPLFFVSPTQSNIQIPWELAGQTQASITATLDGETSGSQMVRLATFAPGIFTTNQQGTGQGTILIANTASMAAPVGVFPDSRPAMRGGFISIFCTGLGDVTNRPATGAPALSNPLSETTTPPSVTIGGVPASVIFSGLAPGFVGLYQVNVEVPADAPTGDAVPVLLAIGGVNSNTVTIAVQ